MAGIQESVTELLASTNAAGGYPVSFVCTHDGLVVASAGEGDTVEYTAAVVSLFDDILVRARRDLGFESVDEVALLDAGHGRTIIRPLLDDLDEPFFLVVKVPGRKTWRRHTNLLRRKLGPILAPLAGAS